MQEKVREFIDVQRPAREEFYSLIERFGELNASEQKEALAELIKKDPDFLDPYLLLFEILDAEGRGDEATKLLDEAYKRALRLVLNDQGNWPDVLEWGWIENRHIIRTFLTKAVDLWLEEKNDEALEILRNLFRSNPNDNPGTRYYILAIRKGMTPREFFTTFDREGFFDSSIEEWFQSHFMEFPDEFEWWIEYLKGLGE